MATEVSKSIESNKAPNLYPYDQTTMVVKQLIVIPIYWGSWWLPESGGAYNWLNVNGALSRVLTGRYMDGLNQYGIGRGAMPTPYIYPIDPPPQGFSDYNHQSMFKLAIDGGHVPGPWDYDLDTQQPFYSLIVKPGIEHLSGTTPDINTGAYHYGFSYDDGSRTWSGQACWVKGDTTLGGTVGRWVHELAESYTDGKGEISDLCQGQPSVLIDGVKVPQYWSVVANSCWPPADPAVTRSPVLREKLGRSQILDS